MKNPKNDPPNSNLPNRNESIIMKTVRYDANHRKLTRGRKRLSTN